MQPQAFKKFATEDVHIHNMKLEYLPSRSFSDLIASENFIISRCTLATVNPEAFIIDNPRRFEVVNSNFTRLVGEGFKVATRGNVICRSCIFNTTYNGPFLGISLNLQEALTQKLLVLDNLTFKEISSRTFRINTTSFNLKINNIFTEEPYNCKNIHLLENVYPLEDMHCFQYTPTSYQEFKGSNCSILRSNATLIIAVHTAMILLILIGPGLKRRQSQKLKYERAGRADIQRN